MRRMHGFGRLLAVLGGTGGLIGLMACSATPAPADVTQAAITSGPASTNGTAPAAPAAAAVPAGPAAPAAPAAAAVPAARAAPAAPAAPAAAQGAAQAAAAAPAHAPAAVPQAGNPAGHAYVPPAGRAVNTSHPNHVIGHGTPASCTSAAVVRAVRAGGIITFNCGTKPVTIVMKQTAKVLNTRHRIVLDGGNKVTLSGGGKIEILYMDTCDQQQVWTTSHCNDQQWPNLTVQNISFTHGYSGVHQGNGQHPYGGGAIYAQGGQFKAVNSRFIDNGCYRYGPDLGGAAIRALEQYKNRPVYITSDTFRGGRCSNGGALSSISVQWDVLNSVLTGNSAIGNGANPASNGTAGGGSGGAIYLDGVKDNVLIAGTIIRYNWAREGGGAVFDVVDQDWGSLTLKGCTLNHNTSKGFQNYPGIFYEVDGQLRQPTVIK